MNQDEFETVDEAYGEVTKLRSKIKEIQSDMRECLCLHRTGATNEQLDFRIRCALANCGAALIDER